MPGAAADQRRRRPSRQAQAGQPTQLDDTRQSMQETDPRVLLVAGLRTMPSSGTRGWGDGRSECLGRRLAGGRPTRTQATPSPISSKRSQDRVECRTRDMASNLISLLERAYTNRPFDPPEVTTRSQPKDRRNRRRPNSTSWHRQRRLKCAEDKEENAKVSERFDARGFVPREERKEERMER